MKKILCLAMAIVMCLSINVPVLADDGDAVAQLILTVKEKFSIDDNEFVFENYSKNEYEGNTVYYMSWKSRENNEYSYTPSISVEIEADGDVQCYYKGRVYHSEPALAKFSEEEAITKAKEYIAIIAPDRVSSLSKGILREKSQYSVYFERLVNGIPVSSDGISVELNPDDLSLYNYNASWTEADFPSADGIISYEQAKSAYTEKIGYELLYNIKTKNRDIEDIYLSYESRDSGAVIDAVSGDATKHRYAVYKYASGAMNDAAEEEKTMLTSLSPEEQKMVDDINKMISKEDAEKAARSIPEFSIRESAEVSGYSVSSNQYGDYIASINFAEDKKDDYYSARVSLNANTKEITSFRESKKYDDETEADTAKAKADTDNFLNKYYAEKISSVNPEFIIGEKDDYSFTYNRYVNNARVKGNSINISVNRYTGELQSLNIAWADTEFPATDNVIAPNAIYKNLITNENFRLQYMVSTEYIYDEKDEKSTAKTKATLVYAMLESPIFSAITGDKIDSRGDKITDKFSGYDDIDNHYCKKAAEELGRIGIYFEGSNLMPDKAVTQIEFLKLMYQALYGYYHANDTDMYKTAISDGIMTEEEISDSVNRITAIKFFVNAMGYKDIAQLSYMFNCPFTDVADDMKGYATLAGGMKLINDRVNVFRSDAQMTRAECLTIIHNYLNK